MTDTTRTHSADEPPTFMVDSTREPACQPVAGTAFESVPSPDGYEVRELVGAGGMGEVFRARCLTFDREVAVKVLHPKYPPDAPAAGAFLREARLAACLLHPGIPPVHQVGQLADGRMYMVMKLVQGQTLDALLKQQGPGVERWLGVFEAVCQTVGYAHSRGVIHRDLKPQNIMIGAFGEVQVMDWGLARYTRGAEGGKPEDVGEPPSLPHSAFDTRQSDLTRTGTTKGTPAYMAPEQARGEVRAMDQRSDVFSLGAVLCALLTGKPPYPGGTAVEVIQAAASGEVAEAFRRLDGCNADRKVIALAKRCLASDSADRPADAAAVATEVGDIRAAAEKAVHTRRVRRWQLALVGVLAAVLAAAGVGWWGNWRVDGEKTNALLRTREELARKLDEVERQLVAGNPNEAFDGYAEAKGMAALDPDPDSAVKVRLDKVRRDCRTAIDLIEFNRVFAQPARTTAANPTPVRDTPKWEEFEKAFARVGITLDLDRPGQTAEQVSRHPFAGAFRDVLEKQGERDQDRVRGKKLTTIAAVVKAVKLSAFARQAEGGTQTATSKANMFGD